MEATKLVHLRRLNDKSGFLHNDKSDWLYCGESVSPTEVESVDSPGDATCPKCLVAAMEEHNSSASISIDFARGIGRRIERLLKTRDYYFLWVYGCVDPNLNGPYDTVDERDAAMEKMREEEGEENHGYFALDVTKGANIEF